MTPQREFTTPTASRAMSLGGLAGRSLELRELRCFHGVACAGNFSRASRELNIASSTLLKHVQRLEHELGTQLLIKHRHGVTLTQAGSSLMDRVGVIMSLLSVPLEQARAPERTAGIISLALPSELAPFLVPRLLEACRAQWPGVTLAIREGTSASLEEWVLDRRVDIALLQDPPTLDELDVEPVAIERLGLVSSVRVVDDTAPVRLRQLAGLKLILPHARHWIRRLLESAAFRRGIELDQVLQAESVALTKEMVHDGLGHTVLPLIAVRDEVARGTLAFRPIEHETLLTVHAIASRGGVAPAPFVTDVRCRLRDAMTNLARSGAWTGASAARLPARSAGPATHSELETAIE